MHRWSDILALQRGETVWPSFCDFHTSNACNQRCIGCAYSGTFDKKLMTEADHFHIIDELHEVGVIAYDFAGGGEPTMLPYLPKLMRHIHSIGGNFALITNGLVMSNDLIDALVQDGTYVRISLEAPNAEDYAAYKQVPQAQWQIVQWSIQRLIDAARRSCDGNDLEISLKFAVGKSFKGPEHYKRCIEIGRKYGVSRVTIKALRHKPEELPEAERILQHFILRQVVYEEGAEDLVSSWIAPLDPALVPECWLTPLHTVVDHLGDVYVCCYYYNDRHEEMWIGNMLKQPFRKFWMGDHHRNLLGNLRRSKCNEVDCKFMKHGIAVAKAANRNHIGWL